MKILLIIVVSLALLVVAGLFLLAKHSRGMSPEIGLDNGQLTPCLHSTNCVISYSDEQVSPLVFTGKPEDAWVDALNAIDALGGTVEQQLDNYLWATFTTPILGFVDDVELLMEPEKQVFHIRSASRVGRSDFGVNRQRIEAIKFRFNKK